MKSVRHQQRGFGLFDGIAALAILAFGLLALTRFQSKLVAQASEAQQRTTAAQLADELINSALIDSASNRVCYTLPAAGGCPVAGAGATALTNSWKNRVLANLPNAVSPVATLSGNGRFTVTLQWTWTSKDGSGAAGELRTHTVISDWR